MNCLMGYFFGPKNKKEELIFAEEEFRIDTQHLINKMLKETKTKPSTLRRKLKMSKTDFDNIFNDTCQIDLRIFAKICYHLDYSPFITTVRKIPAQQNPSSYLYETQI